MILKKLKFLIALFLLFSMNSNAQFWNKLKDKATDKVAQKLDQKTDKMLDKVIDGSQKKPKNNNQNSNYVFLGSATIAISSNGEKANFNVLFNNKKEVFCMHMNAGNGQDVYNVITPKGGMMFMNASGMKIKQSMPADQFSNIDYSNKIPKEDEFKKTGNTKTILGYFCEEYQYKNDGGTISAWVTKSFPIEAKYAPMLGMTSNTNIDGFTLELDYNTANGEKVNVKVVKINKNKKVVLNAAEYKSM